MAQYGAAATMMAAGDSLYQGVRSLTITRELAQFSPPAIIADALGLPFDLALMRRPVGFDLEALLRKANLLSLLGALRKSSASNGQTWLAESNWSTLEAFDNLAFGGATISDLTTCTYETSLPLAQRALAILMDKSVSDRAAVPAIYDLWFNLNVCFVLNPRRRAGEQAKATAVDQIAKRRPKLLFVNIGSNEGLFRLGIGGRLDEKVEAGLKGIPSLMRTLFGKLRTALPAGSCKIYVNSLLCPSFVPNLMPPASDKQGKDGDYFPRYEARIGGGHDLMSKAEMRQADKLTLAINNEVKASLAELLADDARFVDLFVGSQAFDGKHWPDRFVQVSTKRRLRNTPLDKAPIFDGLNSGGLTGLDNMHPTVPGYALIAKMVLDTMGEPLKLKLSDAYKADSLLQDLPGDLTNFQAAIGLLGRLGLFKM